MTALRAVLVGCGGMGNNWAGVLGARPDIDIVGLVDIAPAASGSLATRHGLAIPCFDSLDDALRSLDVDVVLDTSIPETRRRIAGTAMEAGCHVLSEKPLATSVGEAQELLAISARTGKTHAVMQNRRYLAGTQGIRQLVTDGVIGEVELVCADFFLVVEHTCNDASVVAGVFLARRGREVVPGVRRAAATRRGAHRRPPEGRAHKRPPALLSPLDVSPICLRGRRRASGRL